MIKQMHITDWEFAGSLGRQSIITNSIKSMGKDTHNSPFIRIFAPTIRIVYEQSYDRL